MDVLIATVDGSINTHPDPSVFVIVDENMPTHKNTADLQSPARHGAVRSTACLRNACLRTACLRTACLRTALPTVLTVATFFLSKLGVGGLGSAPVSDD